MSLFPLSILNTSQSPHPSKPMNASLSSDAKGKQILIDPVEDRISKLPDDVLVVILKKMVTEDVLKTSVLSKRWKNVWKQVPYLFFNMEKSTIANTESMAAHSDRVAESITKVNFSLSFSIVLSIVVWAFELMITWHFDSKKRSIRNQIQLYVSYNMKT